MERECVCEREREREGERERMHVYCVKYCYQTTLDARRIKCRHFEHNIEYILCS